MATRKLTLHRKLFLARKAAEAVEKRGKNADFDFARAEDVLVEASKQLEKRGILIVPAITSTRELIGKEGVIAIVDMTFEVIDSEGHESFIKTWVGTGHDKPGDKAAYKAITGGTKYFLANLLGIPFGSDPEADRSPAPPSPSLPSEADQLRAAQDEAADGADGGPLLKPVPESDMPEPDWAGLVRKVARDG
jgi:hypothetical protein